MRKVIRDFNMSLRHGMWYSSSMSNLIKSKDRVADFGNVLNLYGHEADQTIYLTKDGFSAYLYILLEDM